MKTKPKPSYAFNAPTSTVRQASTQRPKTAPKTPKRVKTRATPSDHPKTGWIEIAKEKPPEFALVVFGRWDLTSKYILPFWRKSFVQENNTHWLTLPNPPERKCK